MIGYLSKIVEELQRNYTYTLLGVYEPTFNKVCFRLKELPHIRFIILMYKERKFTILIRLPVNSHYLPDEEVYRLIKSLSDDFEVYQTKEGFLEFMFELDRGRTDSLIPNLQMINALAEKISGMQTF